MKTRWNEMSENLAGKDESVGNDRNVSPPLVRESEIGILESQREAAGNDGHDFHKDILRSNLAQGAAESEFVGVSREHLYGADSDWGIGTAGMGMVEEHVHSVEAFNVSCGALNSPSPLVQRALSGDLNNHGLGEAIGLGYLGPENLSFICKKGFSVG